MDLLATGVVAAFYGIFALTHLTDPVAAIAMILDGTDAGPNNALPAHLCSVVGAFHLAFCLVALSAIFSGEPWLRKRVLLINLVLISVLEWTLYAFPPSGTPPTDHMAMPAPLLGFLALCSVVGILFGSSGKSGKAKSA